MTAVARYVTQFRFGVIPQNTDFRADIVFMLMGIMQHKTCKTDL